MAARLQSWGNSALASHFYVGLKNSIKDEIARVGRPTHLEGMISLALQLDLRWYERNQEKRDEENGPGASRSSCFSKSPRPTRRMTTPPSDHEDKMDIDATIEGKESIRAHRRKNDLCFECGKPGHKRPTCPERNSKGKANVSATKQKDPVLDPDSESENE